MKWENFEGNDRVELRIPAENETYDVFRYGIDEKIPVQNEGHNVEFGEALSSFEENTEVYCDWLQTLAVN
jgi:hypothetical protein